MAASADYVRIAGVIDLVTLATDFSAGRWDTISERVEAFADQPAEFGGAVLEARLLEGALLACSGNATEAARALRGLIRDAEEAGAVWPLLAARTTLARLLLNADDPELSLSRRRRRSTWSRAKGPRTGRRTHAVHRRGRGGPG